MDWFVVALAFVAGAALGSFLNVVITRVPKHESIVRPASHCPSCGTPVAPRDNIPIRYWLVEVVTAVVFALVAWVLLA